MLLFIKKIFLGSFNKQSVRFFYTEVHPSKKLLVHGSSAFTVSCIDPAKADLSIVDIPEKSGFCLIESSKIIQKQCSSLSEPSFIGLPALRHVELVQSSAPLSFIKYEGKSAIINSNGAVFLRNVKVDELKVNSCEEFRSEGYVQGNVCVSANSSIYANNLTGNVINLNFKGPNFLIQSAYCEHLNMKANVSGVDDPEEAKLNVHFGTLRGNVGIEIDGRADFSIGSFEGSLNLRQRLGNVSIYLAGNCPLVEIDIAEGDINLSLPIFSDNCTQISGCLDLTASAIDLDKGSLPPTSLDSWDITELSNSQGFYGTFGNPAPDSEHLWRIRTLRGCIRVSACSWEDAMLRNISRANIK